MENSIFKRLLFLRPAAGKIDTQSQFIRNTLGMKLRQARSQPKTPTISMDEDDNFFNPANGLPMMGGFDFDGNPFGIDFHNNEI
jgi:hypothetical protein